MAQIEQPALCTGFDAKTKSWGYSFELQGEGVAECPDGNAIFALQQVLGSRFGDPQRAPYVGSCCPLPDDAITDHRVAAKECPDGFVATGVQAVQRNESSVAARGTGQLTFLLLCSEVNHKRYELGSKTQGWLIGPPGDALRNLGAKPWLVKTHRTVRSRIPAAIRYGMLRRDRYSWDQEGCIGYPWGSILVAREYLHCTGLRYRQLLLRSDDSGAHVAAPVIRPCRAIDDPFSPEPRCVDEH